MITSKREINNIFTSYSSEGKFSLIAVKKSDDTRPAPAQPQLVAMTTVSERCAAVFINEKHFNSIYSVQQMVM